MKQAWTNSSSSKPKTLSSFAKTCSANLRLIRFWSQPLSECRRRTCSKGLKTNITCRSRQKMTKKKKRSRLKTSQRVRQIKVSLVHHAADLTIDKLRQLELKSKRQALNISLFGTLVDDYMKWAKLSNPEESRLGLDEAENAPFVFPSALSTDSRQPAELSRTSLQVGSKTLRQSSLFHAQKAYFTETKVLSALPLQDEKLETSIKIKTAELQRHVRTPFKFNTNKSEKSKEDLLSLFEGLNITSNNIYV